MAARVLALYNHPADAAAFDAHYSQTHVPTAKAIPGLRSYAINATPVAAAGGAASPYYLVAELGFDSLADVQAGMHSPEGAATVADLANFAQAGVIVLVYETREV